jgi:hypothetical protein
MVDPFIDLRDGDAENLIYLILSGLTTRPTLPASLLNFIHSTSRAGRLLAKTKISSACPRICVNLFRMLKTTVYIIRQEIVVYFSPCRCNCKVWCHVRRLIRETWFKNYIRNVRRLALLSNEALSPSNLRKVNKTYRTCPIRRNSTTFIQSFVWENFPFDAHLVMLVSEVAKYIVLC